VSAVGRSVIWEELSMRPNDRKVFADAAKTLGLWILVRRTNEASLQYINKPLYYPKPIDCKCKTADIDAYPGKRLAGLVADPFLYERAFAGGKAIKAKELWRSFWAEKGCRLGANGRPETPPPSARGYGVVNNERSEHHGVLTLNKLYLHGDFDLYDIIDPSEPKRNQPRSEMLHGVLHMVSPHLQKVQDFVNRAVGSPVIQHGGEMQFTGHSEQTIDGFMPSGDTFTTQTQAGIQEVYQIVFEGRQPAKGTK
jgi:hypothetical protein